jgi:hypothetical protein
MIILSTGIAHITLSMSDLLSVTLTYHVFCNAKIITETFTEIRLV